MLAYHGDPEVKAKYLRRVHAHRAADQLIKGTYWEDGKGCAVGCTIHGSDHAAYETELGIPRILARLEDNIFESLDNGHAQAWPERFLKAIKPGVDLSLVWPRFAVWLMVDPQWGVLECAKAAADRKAIQDVADAYQQVVDGSTVLIDWRPPRNAAYSVAYAAAAYAAADAVHASAAAYAAASSAAAYATKCQEARVAQSGKLIEFLETA